LQLWQNTNSSSAGQEYYYFAAAFIGYLLKFMESKKFLIFIQNEEFENAKKSLVLHLKPLFKNSMLK
jgi:hypothetical protein